MDLKLSSFLGMNNKSSLNRPDWINFLLIYCFILLVFGFEFIIRKVYYFINFFIAILT